MSDQRATGVQPPTTTATRCPAVADLRAQIRGADAVLFCTPEYAGTLPGSLKNLSTGPRRPGDYGQPAAWITVAAKARPRAEQTLATVLDTSTPTSSNRLGLRNLYAATSQPRRSDHDQAIRDTLTGAWTRSPSTRRTAAQDAATAGDEAA